MKKTSLALFFTLAAGMLCAQQETLQTFSRNILLEQFTTVNCGYCPPGADRITEAVGSMTNVIWIKHHAGFGTDFLTNDIHTAMTDFYGRATFAPAMMVDRTRFNSEEAGPVTSVGQSGAIRGLFTQAKNVTTYCKVYPVQVSFSAATRTLTGTVSGRFGEENTWDENTRLTIYIIEDSIVGNQNDYTSHGNWSNYVHMGTVRAAVTDMWGDPLEVNAEDRTFSRTFTYTLPGEYVYQHCKVVAFVYQYHATDINSRPVLNAAQSPYLTDTPVGIAQFSIVNSQFSITPNPASSHVALESDEAMETVTIVNSFGQKVVEQTAGGRCQVTVNTASLARGLYLVTVRTARGTATRKLNIVK